MHSMEPGVFALAQDERRLCTKRVCGVSSSLSRSLHGDCIRVFVCSLCSLYVLRAYEMRAFSARRSENKHCHHHHHHHSTIHHRKKGFYLLSTRAVCFGWYVHATIHARTGDNCLGVILVFGLNGLTNATYTHSSLDNIVRMWVGCAVCVSCVGHNQRKCGYGSNAER